MTRAMETLLPRRLLLLAASDAVLVGAILAATSLAVARLQWDALATVSIAPIAIVCVVVLVCLHGFDLYQVRIAANPREVATRLSQVLGTACIVLAGLYSLAPHLLLDRDVVLAGSLITGTALVINRRVFLLLNHSRAFSERALLLGSGQLALALAEELERHPEHGLYQVAWLPDFTDEASLLREVANTRAQRVILALDNHQRLPLEALVELRSQGVRVERGAEAYEEATAKVPLDSLSLGWLLSLDSASPRLRAATKRALSIVVAAPALLVLSPLMALVAVLIRLDSPGPALFCQERVGQGGRKFTLYKFRSMTTDPERHGDNLPCQAGDRRITRLGRLLRRTRLDEMPQLFNVLRGDIALVGPRPFMASQEAELVEKIPYYRYRWAAKPGLTGWAQIHRGYCATVADNTDKLAYDLFYIKHQSLGLDVLILFQTLKIMLLGRGAR